MAIDFSRPQVSRAGPHPYSPAHALIRGYSPNESPLWVLLTSFAIIIVTVLAAAVALAKTFNPRLRSLFALVWFTLCGFLHCTFEGYFIFHYDRLASMQTLYAQLWKEYALSDSRYLSQDSFILSVEGLTMLIAGPLCIAIVVSIVRDSPARHLLQMTMCIFHLYGVALYYASSFTELYLHGTSHSRPEMLYFCIYFIGFNLPWVVVPLFLITDSTRTIYGSMKALRNFDEALLKVQGVVADLKSEDRKTR